MRFHGLHLIRERHEGNNPAPSSKHSAGSASSQASHKGGPRAFLIFGGLDSTPMSLQAATLASVSAIACLQAHDTYGFFEQLDALLMTGPSLTNVNDFRAILIL